MEYMHQQFEIIGLWLALIAAIGIAAVAGILKAYGGVDDDPKPAPETADSIPSKIGGAFDSAFGAIGAFIATVGFFILVTILMVAVAMLVAAALGWLTSLIFGSPVVGVVITVGLYVWKWFKLIWSLPKIYRHIAE